ncbi:MAG: aminotransferase class V-fold PLP-dependent enzyme [Thermodesulfobacteriota bacterium]
MKTKLEFKIATEDWEFEQINELNYKTFVEEIPQHKENEDRALLDKFHSENTYIICTKDRRLLGMMAVRDKRPFSLDQKLSDLNSYLPEHSFACEFRLLSIEQEFRNLRVIQGLLVMLAKFADEKGYDIALISANVHRIRFYKQFGFKPFGPEVGTENALYQPMYLTLESSREFRSKSKILSRLPNNFSIQNEQPVNLLPGPVDLSEEVKKAMNEPPVSHRSEDFKTDFNFVRSQLCRLTGSKNVEILMGSGSLANDAVAAQLSQEKCKGLILSNGEFGERLIDHADRAGLNFETIQLSWGDVFDYQEVENVLIQNPLIKWVWVVHSETSTGVLNDLKILKEICINTGTRMCLDCVSSLGTLSIDLRRVYLASGVSGKGLASYPGLCFVFYNHEIRPSNSLPRYLDIGFYTKSEGIPFTMSSNLIYALSQALKAFDNCHRYRNIVEITQWVRDKIHDAGFEIVAEAQNASPGLLTITLPDWLSSSDLGQKLQDNGFLLHWRSGYLLQRNWIQIALMGECSQDQIRPLFQFLSSIENPISRAL